MAYSAVTVTDLSTEWNPILYGNTPDAPQDHQTGGAEGDLVGSMNVPFFYTAFDDGGTDNISDDTLSFRTRHGADENPDGFDGFMYIGIDADGDLVVDAFVGINNQGSNSDIYIATADPNSSNNSVDTLSIGTTTTYVQTSSTYDWRPVTEDDVPSASLDIDGDLTPNQKNDDSVDYYLSFQISFESLVNVLADEGINLTQDTALRYIVGTSTQPNSFNQDVGGLDGDDDFETPFEDIVVTDPDTGDPVDPFIPVTPTGEMVPEPTSSTFLLLSALFISFIRRR